MRLMLLSTVLAGGTPGFAGPPEFHPPGRAQAGGGPGRVEKPGWACPGRGRKAAGVPVRVENPGWACPCWADIDGDGKKDLLVGQYNGGKIRVYKNLGVGELAQGEWLKADGAVAEVPDVW